MQKSVILGFKTPSSSHQQKCSNFKCTNLYCTKVFAGHDSWSKTLHVEMGLLCCDDLGLGTSSHLLVRTGAVKVLQQNVLISFGVPFSV